MAEVKRTACVMLPGFRVFFVFVVFFGCFGDVETLGLSAMSDSSSFVPAALRAGAELRYLAASIPLAAALRTLARPPPSSRDSFDSSDSISCRRAVTLACIDASTSRFRTFNLDSVIVFKDNMVPPLWQAFIVADSE